MSNADAYPWISEAARRGQSASISLLGVAAKPAPAQVAAAFGLEVGTPVMERRQLMSLDDTPVELVHLFYTISLAAGTLLAENRKITGGTRRVLAELGHAPGRAVEQVGTRLATVD
jgi:GntR family transcriptional regulator